MTSPATAAARHRPPRRVLNRDLILDGAIDLIERVEVVRSVSGARTRAFRTCSARCWEGF
jgi:hypothetical protein